MARINERQREKYWKDPDAAAARLRKWREKNPELQRAIERRQINKDRDKIYARNKQFREENREYMSERSKRLYEETRVKAPWTNCLRGSIRRAKKKGIPFELSNEWAKARWTGHCELTGLPFNLSHTFVSSDSPSIDRIVPEKGYVPDNCRFILSAVNNLKGTGTDTDMLLIARILVAKFGN
jgi:hypothetical protein